MYSYNPYYYEYLAHHGVKGQRWGIRRYQPYTSGQKGIFKNLRRSYKSSVRSLKRDRRRFEAQGNQKAVDAATKAIHDTKATYKAEKKGLKEQFRAENWENYKQEVAERGTEREVKKVYKELSPAQLDIANARLSKLKDFQKMSLRDVEKEYANEQKMAKMDRMIKGADLVSKVALSSSNVISAYKNFKELFKTPTEHELKMEKLEEQSKRANIRKDEAAAIKDIALSKKTLKDAGIFTYKQATDREQMAYDKWRKAVDEANKPKPTGGKSKEYYDSSAPGFNKLSKAAQNGVKAFEKAWNAGLGEKEAEKRRQKAVISTLTKSDAIRVPVSVARKGDKDIHEYILNNSDNYDESILRTSANWIRDHT